MGTDIDAQGLSMSEIVEVRGPGVGLGSGRSQGHPPGSCYK